MEPLFWQVPALVAIGFVSGVLNVLAGGGSLLTLPLLLFIGLPAAVANGTNRIGVICQNIFAIGGFRRFGIFPWPMALLCTAPALLGSYLGAVLAVDIDELLFRRLLALIMVGVLVLTALDPARRWRRDQLPMTPLRLALLLAGFFVIGVYGGFVQAGVGFLVIAGLLPFGLDLVRINAIKVFVILAFTAVALAVFVAHDQVDYTLGAALATGNSLGGAVGSRLAVRKGHAWLQKVVMLTVLVFALKLLIG